MPFRVHVRILSEERRRVRVDKVPAVSEKSKTDAAIAVLGIVSQQQLIMAKYICG